MKPVHKAAAASASLSALFLLVYSSCNWITSHRTGIPSFYFPWERHIPFIPVMILPYMSIDLFFVASPFLARSPRELRTLSTRITLAILIAGICFLLFPLKFAFIRPHVDGPLGLIFNNFRNVDLPFNEFPSLHIALCAILADIYYRHSKGLLRWLLITWFILIALSPLLTYQHHIVDILGGIALAALCFHFAGPQPLRHPFIPNPRIGIYYALGSILLIALSPTWRPWSAWLLWPAFSLALVAAGYLFLGPQIFRKQNARHPWTTSLLLWPVLLGQRISLLYYRQQCQPYNRLTNHLWIGRHLSHSEARNAVSAGITAVIDLCTEFPEPLPFTKINYLQLSLLDLTAPTPTQIDQALAFITTHTPTGIVYLHCKAGYSRTAVIAAAYLLTTNAATTVDQAITTLRQSRPTLIVRPEALTAIQLFHTTHNHPTPHLA